MDVTIRKSVVGLVALAALIGVYLLYTQISQTPPIVADRTQTLAPPTADGNDDAQNRVGTILDVGIGRVKQTRFLHRNEHNEVDRDLGFETLLHQQGSQWEITQPYLKLFLPTFRCEVTANRGKVQVETVFSQLTAGDARFSGNVVIHLVSTEPNDALECFIHLDDVGFLAARSLFSSTGAVRFFAREAQVTGTGMELLYDEAHGRLELFRILQLGSMRFRGGVLSSAAGRTRPRSGAAPSSHSPLAGQTRAAGSPAALPGDCYQCIFLSNVAIETPESIITANDLLLIKNIPWSGSEQSQALTKRVLDPDDPNAAPYPGPNALDTTTSSHAAISSIPPESFDTVVTCDGGFEVTPMGRERKTEDGKPKTEKRERKAENRAILRDSSGGAPERQRVTARRIDFDALTSDTTLDGPVEMTIPLDPNGLREAKAAMQAMPMSVTAQESVRFLAASSRILFAGDCKVTLLRFEPNLTYEYTLTAPGLALDVVSDPNQKKVDAVTARKFVTEGSPAALRIVRRGPNAQILGWTKLNAAQLRYEADPRLPASQPAGQARGVEFTATGPGEVWIRNDELINPKADPNQFSFGRPCVARLTNFDTLKYFLPANRIIAEDDAQQLLLDYFPLVDGKYSRHTRAVAGHIEATLKEITKGHLELATLTATQGIEYEDEAARQSFVGSSLSYDYSQSLVAVRGDGAQRCLLNDSLVDQIDLNLKTGRIKADIPGPSTVQVPR